MLDFFNDCILLIICNFVYYGQMDRALTTRIKETEEQSVLVTTTQTAQHANQFSHSIDFDLKPPLSTRRMITTRDFSLRPGILCETEMWAMNILMFQEFIAHSRDLFSHADRLLLVVCSS